MFGDGATNETVYKEAAAALVESALSGVNGTVFAYGQTGTGKTFTITGVPKDTRLKGIMPRSFETIFNQIHADTSKEYLVRASYLEIYNEEIRDLLGKDPKNKLDLKENIDSGVYVKDLTSFVVKSVGEDFMRALDTEPAMLGRAAGHAGLAAEAGCRACLGEH